MRIRLVFAAATSIILCAGFMHAQTKNSPPAQKAKAPEKAAASPIPDLVLKGKVAEAIKLALKSPAGAATALTSLMATADAQIASRKIDEAQVTMEAAQKFVDACDKAGTIKDLPRDALKGRQSRLQGIQLSDKQDFAKAEAFLRQALQISIKIKDLALQAGVHNNLGFALENMDLLEEAAKEYETTRQLAEEQKDDLRIASSSYNLGTVLFKLKRFDAALAAFKLASEKSQTVSRPDIQAMSVRRQAQILSSKEPRGETPVKIYQEAADLFEKLGDAQNAGVSYIMMGEHHAYNVSYRKAAECGEKAIPFLSKSENKAGLQRCYEFLGDMYGRLGEIPTAEKYKKLAKELEPKK